VTWARSVETASATKTPTSGPRRPASGKSESPLALGQPGNSGWHSTDARVNAVTSGRPINFVNGRPDFTTWAKMAIKLPVGVLTGNDAADQALARKALDAGNNPDVQASGSARRFMADNQQPVHSPALERHLSPASAEGAE
jgi:hypothetical protein